MYSTTILLLISAIFSVSAHPSSKDALELLDEINSNFQSSGPSCQDDQQIPAYCNDFYDYVCSKDAPSSARPPSDTLSGSNLEEFKKLKAKYIRQSDGFKNWQNFVKEKNLKGNTFLSDDITETVNRYQLFFSENSKEKISQELFNEYIIPNNNLDEYGSYNWKDFVRDIVGREPPGIARANLPQRYGEESKFPNGYPLKVEIQKSMNWAKENLNKADFIEVSNNFLEAVYSDYVSEKDIREITTSKSFEKEYSDVIFPKDKKDKYMDIFNEVKLLAKHTSFNSILPKLTHPEILFPNEEWVEKTSSSIDDIVINRPGQPTVGDILRKNLFTEAILYENASFSPSENIIRINPTFSVEKETRILFVLAHEYGHALDFRITGSKDSVMKVKRASIKKCLTKSANLRPDQLDEAFADWYAGEVLAEKFKKMEWAGIKHESRLNMISSAVLACGDKEDDPKDVHASSKKRINQIVLANPTLRQVLGCGNVRGSNYCSWDKWIYDGAPNSKIHELKPGKYK